MEKKVNSKVIFQGKVVSLYEDDVLCDNGKIAKREIVKHNGGVCILSVFGDKILMERQYRYAYNEVLYELPAGKIEKGEDPYLAALREFEEETGYRANSLKSYGEMYPTCGYSNEIIYLYLAHDIKESSRHLDEDEEIDLEFIEINKVKEMILNGKIKDAKTICLISKYLLEVEKR